MTYTKLTCSFVHQARTGGSLGRNQATVFLPQGIDVRTVPVRHSRRIDGSWRPPRLTQMGRGNPFRASTAKLQSNTLTLMPLIVQWFYSRLSAILLASGSKIYSVLATVVSRVSALLFTVLFTCRMTLVAHVSSWQLLLSAVTTATGLKKIITEPSLTYRVSGSADQAQTTRKLVNSQTYLIIRRRTFLKAFHQFYHGLSRQSRRLTLNTIG